MSGRTQGIRPPDASGNTDNLNDRLTDRERRTNSTSAARVPFAYVFTYTAALVAGDLPIPPLWQTGRLWVVRFQPQTAGSTATTLQVKKNGTALTPNTGSSTITLTGGVSTETSIYFGLDAHMFHRTGNAAADQLKITIVTVGTGAVGLTILADFV